jgi:alpha/beta superfamily hydrolase
MTGHHDSRNFFLQGPAGKLEAVLWTPRTQQQAHLAALVCHPHPLFGGTLHNKVVYQAAKALDSFGIPVLRFNFRGAGLSEGTHDRGQGEQGDVRAALDFLAGEYPGVPLLLAGFSFGSWVGLRIGCADERVVKLIGIGAPVDKSDFSYLRSCTKPKLFVQGSKDQFADPAKLRALVKELPGANQVVVVDGVDHFFTGKIEELGTAIVDWMSR